MQLKSSKFKIIMIYSLFKEAPAEEVNPYDDVELVPTTTEAPIANCMRYDEDGYTIYMVSCRLYRYQCQDPLINF